MSVTGEQPERRSRSQQSTGTDRSTESGAEQRVENYMLSDEEISYDLRFRPTGLVNWIKSLLGYGVTHWFVTNQRLIEETRVSGGFLFQDVPHDKISSVEYGTKLSVPVLALGVLLSLGGLVSFLAGAADGAGLLLLVLGAAIVGYAYWRRQQVLAVHASGGVTFSLAISKGNRMDEFLWYLHAERNKHAAST
jgi:hypothetical protein